MAPLNTRPAPPRREPRARFARWSSQTEPPSIEDVAGDDADLIERLFTLTAASCLVPPLAVREAIENLVHAEFRGACITVDWGGARLRVSDCGPGISDKARAVEPGYSTACDRVRAVARGVGSGLPIIAATMEAHGGTMELDDNLRGGTVLTLTLPDDVDPPPAAELSEQARRLMALLVEMAPADPETLAAELAITVGTCGRELVILEHRELVSRAADGARSLTAHGANLLATLF
jgi:anti-sigma regulatory factor (Ser/Thr protein kinase)